MGTGQPRPLDCGSSCDGPVAGKALLAPAAIAAAPDGSVFVADHSLVRRIGPNGIVTTLLHLKYVTEISFYRHFFR